MQGLKVGAQEGARTTFVYCWYLADEATKVIEGRVASSHIPFCPKMFSILILISPYSGGEHGVLREVIRTDPSVGTHPVKSGVYTGIRRFLRGWLVRAFNIDGVYFPTHVFCPWEIVGVQVGIVRAAGVLAV